MNLRRQKEKQLTKEVGDSLIPHSAIIKNINAYLFNELLKEEIVCDIILATFNKTKPKFLLLTLNIKRP